MLVIAFLEIPHCILPLASRCGVLAKVSSKRVELQVLKMFVAHASVVP